MKDEIRRLQVIISNSHKINQAILDNQPIESIAELAVEGVSELISYSRISIAILDNLCDTATILTVKSSDNNSKLKTGQSIPFQSFGDIDGLKNGIIQQGETLVSQSDDKSIRDTLLVEGIHSYIIIPLITKGELIGMLNVGRKDTKKFDQVEVELLKKMGTQLSISIFQSQLNKKNEQKKQELSTLLKISNLLASTIDLEEILQITIDESTNVMGVETGAIYLLQDEELHLGATTPPLPPNFPNYLRSAHLEHHPHISKAVNTRQPVLVADTSTAELTPQEEEVIIKRGLKSILMVPLIVGSRSVGINLMGTTAQSKEYSENEINLCKTFSAQMALAIENVRLYHKTYKQAADLERRVNERTSELEALTYAISHDLRAPLRAIKGFGEILKNEHFTSLNDEGQDYLSKMLEAGNRLGGMFERLLSLTKIGARKLHLQYLDLSDISGKILEEICNAELNREIEYIILPCGTQCKTLFADKGYVEILMTNLISNAIKFTKNKKLTRIEFGCYIENGKGIYYLKDNGIGFDMAAKERVFAPFQRLHSEDEFPGYGIGMTIVTKIVELHKGQIWIDSEIEKGTTVYFSLEDLTKNN